MKVQELFEDAERSILSVIGEQPEHVDGGFSCNNNKLTSLDGAPSSVGGGFFCNFNKLTSLDGAPSYIGKGFCCMNNKLTSLHNIHKQIKHIGEAAYFGANPIRSHVLGLLLIEGLKKVWLGHKKVQEIINKHLEGDRDVFACQEELIDAGLDEYAQL